MHGYCIEDICSSWMFKNQIKLTLFQFTKNCAFGLLLAGKLPNRTPGWSKKCSLSPTPNVDKKPTVAKPVLDVQYDGIHHWPEFRETRNQYRVCRTLVLSTVQSAKCVYVYRKEEIVFMISITDVAKPDQKLALLSWYSWYMNW